MSQVRSSEIAVPGPVLDDLRVRLDRTRPARGAAAGWLTGTDPGYRASLATSRAGQYQRRDTGSALNGLAQLLASVAGADIHVSRIGAGTPAKLAEHTSHHPARLMILQESPHKSGAKGGNDTP